MSEPLMSVAGQLVGIPAEKYSGTNGVTVDQNNKTIGLDETVLFETNVNTSSATLSENISAFNRVDFYIFDDNGGAGIIQLPYIEGNYKAGCYLPSLNSPNVRFAFVTTNDNGTSWTAGGAQYVNGAWWDVGTGPIRIKKVVGVNRISGGNA